MYWRFSDFETYSIKIILNDERYDSEYWQRLPLPFFEVDFNKEEHILSDEDIIGFDIRDSEGLRKTKLMREQYRKYSREMTEKIMKAANRNTLRNSMMEYFYILYSNDLIKLNEYLSNHKVNEKVNGESLIYWVVFYNKLLIVKRLIELGADPNQKDSLDRSLLEIGSYFGFYDVCKKLLEKGGRPTEECTRRAENGWGGFRQVEIIELLSEWIGS